MSEFFKTSPEIIKAAAQSPLGILALIILAVSVLAFVFFKRDAVSVRLLVFGVLFVGGIGAFLGAIRVESDQRKVQPAPQEATRVKDLKGRIVSLQVRWESVGENPAARLAVQSSAAKLAGDLDVVPDAALAEGDQLIKYKYLGIAHVMSADVAATVDEKIAQAKAAIAAADRVLSILDDLRKRAPSSAYAQRVANWADEKSFADAANYVAALAYAIGSTAGESDWRDKGLKRLNVVDPRYQREYGRENNPVFRPFFPNIND